MRRTLAPALVAICLGVLTATAGGGVLNGHPAAYVSGAATWSGSTAFDNSLGVAGYVDWAVFGPGQFPFVAGGYTPTAGEVVYAYQVFNTGSKAIPSLAVALSYAADAIGSFSSLGGDPITGATVIPGAKAEWQFSGIVPGSGSEGLAFSSSMIPQGFLGFVLGGGTFALMDPLPSPSSLVPEPCAAGVLALGGLAMMLRKRA